MICRCTGRPVHWSVYEDTAHFIINRLNHAVNHPSPIHLYLTNIEVDAHKAQELYLTDGPREEFMAPDGGNVENLTCPAARRIYLKCGTPLIVLYDISDEIHNGTRGVFIQKDGEDGLIEVDGVPVTIERRTWASYNRDGKIVETRCQIPLRLFWASTVNKVQGQELSGVCFHSSYEFTGGLIYTALSRVKRAEDLHPSHVKRREQEIVNMNLLPNEPFETNCHCCNRVVSNAQAEREQRGIDNEPDVFEFVANCSDELGEDFQVVFQHQGIREGSDNENVSFFSDPPDDFDYKSFLLSYKENSKLAECDGFAKEKNAVIEDVVTSDRKLSNMRTYIKIVWKIAHSLRKFVRPENVQGTRIRRPEFTKIAQQVWHGNVSKENHLLLKAVFEKEKKNFLKQC